MEKLEVGERIAFRYTTNRTIPPTEMQLTSPILRIEDTPDGSQYWVQVVDGIQPIPFSAIIGRVKSVDVIEPLEEGV